MTTLEIALAEAGTDIDAVVTRVDSAVGLRDDDVLLAVGSLVEDLGTTTSDVDLLLVSSRAVDADVLDLERAWMVGPRIFDLTVVPRSAVDDLCARLEAWADRPWNLMHRADIDDADRLRLHRLVHGRQLYPIDRTTTSYRSMAAPLARLKLHVARHTARTIQVDMVGLRDAGDHASMVYAAQDLLGQAVDALLAAHGLTNPYPKWRNRLLDRLSGDWDRPLGLHPPGRTATRTVWDLHRAPLEPRPDLAIDHAHRCVDFTRAVSAWAELTLVGGAPHALPVPRWDERGDGDGIGPTLPRLELDVDISTSATGIALARLNREGPVLEVSAGELAVLLLGDGATSIAAAEAAVGCGGVVDVSHVVERARVAGLCAEPMARSCR